uniref:G_PROTEIN_RECEP_F1_2 domain-containing protein n=1 Tax=Trichuris muris TaxID=70415 RepID=A0A5S6R5S2_TRIMR
MISSFDCCPTPLTVLYCVEQSGTSLNLKQLSTEMVVASTGLSPGNCFKLNKLLPSKIQACTFLRDNLDSEQAFCGYGQPTTITAGDLLMITLPNSTMSLALNATLSSSVSDQLLQHPVYQHHFLFNVICSVLMIIVAVVGLIGNTIFIQLFWQSSSPTSMDILLTGLAAADSALLLSGTPVFSVIALYTYSPSVQLMKAMNYLTVTLYPISMMAHCASVWTMVSVSIESPRKSVTCLVVIAVLSVAYNFCRFWEYKLNHRNDVVPFLRSNELYVQVFVHWMYFFTVFGIPLLTLASVNCCIVNTIFRARRLRSTMSRSQLRQHRLAVMMVVLVLVFFISNALAFVLNALEAAGFFDNVMYDRYIFYCLTDVNNLLIEFNSSINLFIYLIFCRRLRARFWYLFRCSKPEGKIPLFPFRSVERMSSLRRSTSATYRRRSSFAVSVSCE